MSISPQMYEDLGAFYLGREIDLKSKSLGEAPLLYDSKDLVTHGVVLGMTGSGKTGLCMALLEEAAMDSIPAIVIDPKGDIPNLMLTFPEFRGEDFRPWINEEDARKKGQSPDQYAAGQAELWKGGLERDWGQTADRVRQFQNKVDVRVYTPGSRAGIPVSILSSLAAPPFEILDDPELLSDRVENAVTSLLGLIGMEADPMQSSEHILFSQILLHAWRAEEDVTLPGLIERVQKPPFDRVGVVPLESFMEEKKRFALAMQLNRLLASPRFQSWTEGVPLDVKRLLHDPSGKPQVSIFSIAHMDDSERMFFVSMLLNQMLSWMRLQSGTSSLRALLYMDEIFGYLPPVQNPPSKKPLLTLLKQGRAFGLGCLLATQNPVDLDYKALSNIGTWFLGRLQTARDQERVLDGLEGAAASQEGGFDRAEMETLLAGLDSRVFLLNNVHEDGPVTFHVRWVMSYLRGPLSRRQIKQLMDPYREEVLARGSDGEAAPEGLGSETSPEAVEVIYQLPRSIDQMVLPLTSMQEGSALVYRPGILGVAEVSFNRSKWELHGSRTVTLVLPFGETPLLDFGAARRFEREWHGEETEVRQGASRAVLPVFAQEAKYYTAQKRALEEWVYAHEGITLFQSPTFEVTSKMNESERDFRVRLQELSRESRDAQLEKLRGEYARKMKSVEGKIETAERALRREQEQAKSAKIGSVISMGSAILSAFLGRKRVSLSSVSRGATAARGVSRSMKESRDVDAAEDRVVALEEELKALDEALSEALEELRQSLDPLTIPLEPVRVQPYKKDIRVKRLALAWLPCVRLSEWEARPAWLPPSEGGN